MYIRACAIELKRLMDTSQNMLLTQILWYATTSKTTTTTIRKRRHANVDNIMARNQCFGIITEKYMFVIMKFKDHLRKYITITVREVREAAVVVKFLIFLIYRENNLLADCKVTLKMNLVKFIKFQNRV